MSDSTAGLPNDPIAYGSAGNDSAAAAGATGGAGQKSTDLAGSGVAGQSAAAGGSAAGAGGSAAGSGYARAGSGGSLAAAGSGGSLAAAGSGGTQSAGAGGSGSTCPAAYTMATHIVINVSWSSSLALAAGSGKVHLWTRSKFVESGQSASVASQSCGSVLPVVTTSAIAGSEKILPEIPDAAWDEPSMPTFTGTATKNGDTLTIDSGVALVGLSMSNPTASWPAASAITGVDHDSDGNLGITAIPKTGSGYYAPPTSLAKTSRADQLYLAIRNIMKLTATVSGCPDSYTGTANVTNFDNHVIGCHVQGGSGCTTTQRDFVDQNRTVYTLQSASFTSQRVNDSASCADVRALLPMN